MTRLKALDYEHQEVHDGSQVRKGQPGNGVMSCSAYFAASQVPNVHTPPATILGIGGSGCGRLNPRRSSSTASISVVPPPTLQFCAKHGIGITRFGGLRITHREGWDDWTEGSLLAGRWLGRASCYCCTC
uniref:Uncharacterized protein n=1 Tax=Pyricularia oryzae (strain P131) TaxID=1143193 RepID=L7ISG8_PYRO1